MPNRARELLDEKYRIDSVIEMLTYDVEKWNKMIEIHKKRSKYLEEEILKLAGGEGKGIQ